MGSGGDLPLKNSSDQWSVNANTVNKKKKQKNMQYQLIIPTMCMLFHQETDYYTYGQIINKLFLFMMNTDE